MSFKEASKPPIGYPVLPQYSFFSSCSFYDSFNLFPGFAISNTRCYFQEFCQVFLFHLIQVWRVLLHVVLRPTKRSGSVVLGTSYCSEARLTLMHPFFTSSIAATMNALFHFSLFRGDCRQGGADVERHFRPLDFFCFRLRGITLNVQ